MSHTFSVRGGSATGNQKLPRLHPHVNKRAQQIIADHLNSVNSATSSVFTGTIPVLEQLESTAPRTARTHDISHLCDKPGFLTPRIPPSLIREEDHRYEAGFLSTGAHSFYNDRDGMWHTKVFPSNTPSSRTDAVMLDAWITRALRKQQDSLEQNSRSKDDLVQTVEASIPILSVALHEVVRQVTHHCAERGVALDKIWRTYVELFHRVLRQMQQSLCDQKQMTIEAQGKLDQVRVELQNLRKEHPEHMHSVIAELEEKFRSKQKQYEQDLTSFEEENMSLKTDMRNHHKELEIWYPQFAQYQDSYIKTHLPGAQKDGFKRRPTRLERKNRTKSLGHILSEISQDPDLDDDIPDDEIPPEVAIAEDFKRLLAVLPPDKRKIIGQELSHIMDAQGPTSAGGKDNKRQLKKQQSKSRRHQVQPGEDRDKVRELQTDVKQQEDRIKELREEIYRTETEQAAAAEAAAAATAATAAAEAKAQRRSMAVTMGSKAFDDEEEQDKEEEPQLGDASQPLGFKLGGDVGLEMLRATRDRPQAMRVKTQAIEKEKEKVYNVEDSEDSDD